jgi:hypothetical protein
VAQINTVEKKHENHNDTSGEREGSLEKKASSSAQASCCLSKSTYTVLVRSFDPDFDSQQT